MERVALHGFLGRPQDWEGLTLSAPDLFAEEPRPFEEWAEAFVKDVAEGSFLIGYSLGGRLALHALLAAPEKWSGAAILSAHPGLQSGEERKERLESDRRWAERFRSEPWEELMHAWNGQSVFTTEIRREEGDFSRERLAQALEIWSLGRQRDLRCEIAELPMPICWATGERDPKFCALAESVTLSHRKSQKIIIKNCGHRILKLPLFTF